jgi:HAD superfamily hydrolase (TIGR01484 family)
VRDETPETGPTAPDPGASAPGLRRYHVLACDYDGTLAEEGRVPRAVVDGLVRVKHSGRKLLLVTGRVLGDLAAVFPELELFDRVVAENGAVLHDPASGETRALAPEADARLVEALRDRGVAPLSVGACIVATWEPWQDLVLESIRALGLELQVIFNKGAVMVLPSSVNKATGLAAALLDLGLSPRNAVGVGDAENDHAFLSLCECAVAVRNALPALQERADWVTAGDHGRGVLELIESLVTDDLAALAPERHQVRLGLRDGGAALMLPSWGASLLIAGTSGSGKSTLAIGLLERLVASGAQTCVIDPEGDYAGIEGATTLGTPDRAPDVDEAMQLLADPATQLVVECTGVPLSARPDAFNELLSRILELRARTGRPHWVMIDEAHHVMPRSREAIAIPANSIWITVHPDHVDARVLERVDRFVAVGKEPGDTLGRVATGIGRPAPPSAGALEPGEALLWDGRDAPIRFRVEPPRAERRRHVRKYAEGTLPEDRSFYFRGADARLRLRASNLQSFLDLADGVDADTWLHHLEAHHYSDWVRSAIKDADLADEIHAIERAGGSADATRAAVRHAIEARYTAPA